MYLCERFHPFTQKQVEEFVENLNFLRDIQNKQDEILAKFTAVTDMYKMMEDYDVCLLGFA